jgi:hypothetical protein
MTTTPHPGATQAARPRIEELLEQAHQALSALGLARHRLLQRGLSADDLPNEDTLMAFAALGDHERGVLLDQLRESAWQEITDRGLAKGASLEGESTPMLRLYSHLFPHLTMIDTVAERLASVDRLPEPPAGLLRIDGRMGPCYWGEPLELRVVASRDVAAMRIDADEAFDLDPMLLRKDAAGPIVQDIELLADVGQLHVTVEDLTGARFRLSQPVRLAASPEELWQ